MQNLPYLARLQVFPWRFSFHSSFDETQDSYAVVMTQQLEKQETD
jgi:hypothetical protein